MTAGRAERESTKRGSHTMVVMSLLLATRLRESRRTSSAITRSRRRSRSRNAVCEVFRRFRNDGADEPARAGRRGAARRVALRRDSHPSSESRLAAPHCAAPRNPESRRFQDFDESATNLSRYRNYAQSWRPWSARAPRPASVHRRSLARAQSVRRTTLTFSQFGRAGHNIASLIAAPVSAVAAARSCSDKNGTPLSRALVPAIRARAAHDAAGCHLRRRAAGRLPHIYTR